MNTIDHNALLQVEDLSISFRSGDELVDASKHISFRVYPGKTLAIVGESGSGKSVSSLSLLQLLDKRRAFFRSGTFTFSSLFQDELSGQSHFSPDSTIISRLRGKKIAMIFQEPMTALNPVMPCGEQVAEMIRLHSGLEGAAVRDRVIDLFREVKLPRCEDIYKQYPHQLSGGQRQRVMIALAISCKPALLIADEPTTALDVTVQKEILLLLKSLQETHGMAMIFITHDLGVVSDIADEVLVMRRGEMVEYGAAKDVLNNPKHAYTRGLLACRPSAEKKNHRLLTISDFLDSSQQPEDKIYPEYSSNASPLLVVENLSRTYVGKGGLLTSKKQLVHAVRDVSFTIGRGETLGLVGESGCGKTTLSRMLLGLIPASAGCIRYSIDTSTSGVDITKCSSSELRAMRRHIQIIFQDPYSSLNPRMSIEASLTEPMLNFGIESNMGDARRKAMKLMENVGLLPSHLNRYPHEFSGGQRQRIVIARALACDPRFIICDESVSALDVSVQAQVLNLLNELKQEYGLTYLFISHDLNVVYHMSDRIMVMNQGVIEESGLAKDVFSNPQSAYTRKLLAAVPGSGIHLD